MQGKVLKEKEIKAAGCKSYLKILEEIQGKSNRPEKVKRGFNSDLEIIERLY